MTNNKQKMLGFKQSEREGRREGEIPTSCAVLVTLGSHAQTQRDPGDNLIVLWGEFAYDILERTLGESGNSKTSFIC